MRTLHTVDWVRLGLEVLRLFLAAIGGAAAVEVAHHDAFADVSRSFPASVPGCEWYEGQELRGSPDARWLEALNLSTLLDALHTPA